MVDDEQQSDGRLQQPIWIMTRKIPGNSVPACAAELGADDLNNRHERQVEQHRPDEAEAEGRQGLAIGADAGGIIVRSASDALDQEGPTSAAWKGEP